MSTIKEFFEKGEDGKLTYEEFEALTKEAGAKFKDLSTGQYVSIGKYNSDLEEAKAASTQLQEQIDNLNGTITTRDADLEALQKQVEAAKGDAAKLAELGQSLTDLQTKYEADVKNYQSQMEQQAYEFAVKEYVNTQKFSSKAAKRDFTQAMLNANLQMKDKNLIGAEDFKTLYEKDNDDAFYKEPEVVPEPEPVVEPEPKEEPVPTIVASTQGQTKPNEDFGFHFSGVRAKQ